MEVKPGYKRTEVGVIPAEWEVKRLGEIATVATGNTPPTRDAANYGDEFLFVSPVDLGEKKHVTITEKRLSKGGFAISRRFPRDSILFVCIGSTIGKCGVAPVELTSNQQINAIFPSPTFSADYLYYFICQVAPKIRALAGEQAVPIVNKTQFSETAVAFPPLPEQRAIAAALSDVDGLLGGLDRLIAKKRDLKKAAMQQLLTGQTRLKGFGPARSSKRAGYGLIPDDWGVRPFKSVSSMNGRIGWQGLKQEEFTDNPDDPFLITGMNFEDGNIHWEDVYHIPHKRYHEAQAIQLRAGDVLMTKDGTIGKLLYVDHIPHPGTASLNSHLLVFRPIDRQYFPKFLFYQLGSPAFAQHIELHKSGSTFFGLTQEATGKYPVILPSLAEQIAIAGVLSDMDAELAALEKQLAKTRALKQGMMQELLTGRIRLVEGGELRVERKAGGRR